MPNFDGTGTTQIGGDGRPYFPRRGPGLSLKKQMKVGAGGVIFWTGVTPLVLATIYVLRATPEGMICAIA